MKSSRNIFSRLFCNRKPTENEGVLLEPLNPDSRLSSCPQIEIEVAESKYVNNQQHPLFPFPDKISLTGIFPYLGIEEAISLVLTSKSGKNLIETLFDHDKVKFKALMSFRFPRDLKVVEWQNEVQNLLIKITAACEKYEENFKCNKCARNCNCRNEDWAGIIGGILFIAEEVGTYFLLRYLGFDNLSTGVGMAVLSSIEACPIMCLCFCFNYCSRYPCKDMESFEFYSYSLNDSFLISLLSSKEKALIQQLDLNLKNNYRILDLFADLRRILKLTPEDCMKSELMKIKKCLPDNLKLSNLSCVQFKNAFNLKAMRQDEKAVIRSLQVA